MLIVEFLNVLQPPEHSLAGQTQSQLLHEHSLQKDIAARACARDAWHHLLVEIYIEELRVAWGHHGASKFLTTNANISLHNVEEITSLIITNSRNRH